MRDEGLTGYGSHADAVAQDKERKRRYERDRPDYICPVGSTGATSEKFRAGWDRIFGKGKK
jgi:hypothetical protein